MRTSAAVAALILLVVPSPAAATPAHLDKIGIATDPLVTEITVALSRKTTYTARTLKPMQGHPFRLYIDFDKADLGPAIHKRRALATGPVLRVRAGQFTRTEARIVFDLKEVAPYTIRTENNPYRVVFRIESATKAAARAPRGRGLARLWRRTPRRELAKSSGRKPHRAPGAALDAAGASSVTPAASVAATTAGAAARSGAGRKPGKPLTGPPSQPSVRKSAGAAHPRNTLPKIAASRHRTHSATASTAAIAKHKGSTTTAGRAPGPPNTLPGSIARSFSYPGITLAAPPRIVIDPGHGGRDPGARGINGMWEKDVTLAVSRDLARRLRERLGIEVILTRRRDRTLSFAQRAAYARGADSLFISVHANACKQAWVKGVETFYSPATRNGAASRRLARLVHQRVLRSVDRTYGPVHNGGVHARRLAVLRHSHAPGLLLEAAYLTNPVDSHRLADARYRNALVDGVVDGIVDYLSGIKAPLRLVSRSDARTRTR